MRSGPAERLDRSDEFGKALGGLGRELRLPRRAAPVLVEVRPVPSERFEPYVATELFANGVQPALQDAQDGLVVVAAALEVERDLQTAVTEPQLEVLSAVVVEDLEDAAHPLHLV